VREETEAFCRERELLYRVDSSNRESIRGLIRGQILPLLEELHPAARANILRALDKRRTMPPALATLLDSPDRFQTRRSRRRLMAVREPTASGWSTSRSSCLARSRGRLAHRSTLPGLRVRGWRPGDRSPAARRKCRTCSSTRNSPL